MKATRPKIFFAANIKFLRQRQKLSQEALAERLGLTRAKLAAMEVGTTKSPQPEDYLNFSEFFQVSVDTLLKVDLSKLGELKLRELEAGNDVYIRGGNLRVLAISVDRSNQENVEYVPIKAKAGYAAQCADKEFIAALPKAYLPNLPRTGTFRIFPITGDSMLPIPSGAELLTRFVADWTDLKANAPCIMILRGEQDFVFKLATLEADGHFLLRSLNSAYAPYRVAVEDVLEVWKFYSYSSKEFPPAPADLDRVLQAIVALGKRVGG